MSAKSCEHTTRVSATVELDFIRPSEPKAPYSAPVSVLMCENCGHLELFAALPKLLGDWLKKR